MEENEEVFSQDENTNYTPIGYKIQSGREYIIHRKDYNGSSFYKIAVSKKNAEGLEITTEKQVTFKSGVEVKDKTKIRILAGFEDFYIPKRDKFHPVFKVVITDFEITGQPPEVINEAYAEFNSQDDMELPF